MYVFVPKPTVDTYVSQSTELVQRTRRRRRARDEQRLQRVLLQSRTSRSAHARARAERPARARSRPVPVVVTKVHDDEFRSVADTCHISVKVPLLSTVAELGTVVAPAVKLPKARVLYCTPSTTTDRLPLNVTVSCSYAGFVAAAFAPVPNTPSARNNPSAVLILCFVIF